jgi:hypothetical protein
MDSYLNSINSLKTKSGNAVESNKKLKDTINELYSIYGGFKKQVDKLIHDVNRFYL